MPIQDPKSMIDQIDVAEMGGLVKIKGTHNMTWVQGWIKAVDSTGHLIFDRSSAG